MSKIHFNEEILTCELYAICFQYNSLTEETKKICERTTLSPACDRSVHVQVLYTT